MFARGQGVQRSRVRVLGSIEDIASMEKEWEQLRNDCGAGIFSSHHLVMEWLEAFHSVAEPRFLCIEKEGSLAMVAPFVQNSRRHMGVSVRSLYMAGWANRTLEYYDIGILHRAGENGIPDLLEGMAKMDWNLLNLNGLSDCPYHNDLMQKAASIWPSAQMVRIPCPYLDLSGHEDVTDLFGTRNRRTVRKVVRELSGSDRLDSTTLEGKEEMERAMMSYVEMHRRRWSDKGGSIFQDSRQRDFLVGMARLLAERSQGRIYETRIDGVLAAQALCIFDRGMARIYRISMNDELMSYSPGYLLFQQMLTDLKREGIKKVDLGAGPEEFKYRLGARDAYVLGLKMDRGGLRMASRLGRTPGVGTVLKGTGLRERFLKGVS